MTAVALSYSRQYEFTSAVNQRTYRIMVALPPRYVGLRDTLRYPVLYVLDGNGLLPLATETQRLLNLAARGKPGYSQMILVGIGYQADNFPQTREFRGSDYTPTAVNVHDTVTCPVEACGDGPTGGAPAFLRVIRDEIIPRIDREYRTTGDRGILGHSYGGLFATYALFAAPDLFSRYGILSPSLWWDKGLMFEREAAFANGRTELQKRVFISVGALEQESMMVMPTQRMATVLRSRSYRGLDLESVVFPDEYHVSVVPAALSRALRFLYNIPNPCGPQFQPC